MIKVKLFAACLLAGGIALSPLMPTNAAESSSTANVSFTEHALNPADPNLPMPDLTHRQQLPDTSGEKQVVVNTNTNTEKPKKAAVAKTTKSAEATKSTTTSPTRRTLPQTGTVEMSGMTVVSLILMGLAMVAGVFKKSELDN